MPRIRSLKPDLWIDEALGQASIEAQCLFIGLITQADDEGRLNGNLDRLRIQIWPYKSDVDAARVDQLLDELAARELVQRYEVRGKPYLFLLGWEKNQRIHNPSASELPAPSEADPSGVQTKPPLAVIGESSRGVASPRPGREGKGGEGNTSPSALGAGAAGRVVSTGKGRSSGSPSEATESGAGAESGADSRSATAVRIFEYWRQQVHKPNAKFTLDRRRKVEGRLREGYTEADIRKAIDGAARAAFVNDQGKRFDDLELICRTGSKLEDFIARSDARPAIRGGTHPSPSSAALVAALNQPTRPAA